MFTRLSSLVFLTCLAAAPLQADMVDIPADRDASLIESANGEIANGLGPHIRAGHTNQPFFGVRRALIHFDVAGELPEDAIIDRVFLTLYENSENAVPGEISLHRVLSDWGEGASLSGGGSGAPAVEGDTTWLHTFYEYDYWVHQGGHFIERASGTETVGGNDFYTWQSTVHMVNNVRHWLHNPERNFGWLVMGDEYTRGSVKRFASRNSGNSAQRPVLTVEYHLPGE
jgi:hypothetical protein